VWGPGDYLQPFPIHSTDDLNGELHTAGRAQGERAGERGPEETVRRLGSRIGGLAERLHADDVERLLDLRPILPAAIRLGDFLCTRIVELVVHGDDLAVSVGLDESPPAGAAAVTMDTLVETARTASGDVEVIRGLARAERTVHTVFPVL